MIAIENIPAGLNDKEALEQKIELLHDVVTHLLIDVLRHVRKVSRLRQRSLYRVVEHLDIEVRIWSYEIEDIELLMTEPVFPTFVPAFYQHLLQTVLGCKVDVALYLLVGCTMGAIRLALAVIGYTETNRWQVVGIAPGLGANDHVPPYTAVLGRMNP